jgi:5-methylcytosine-specific restriction endonuclease McrA
MSQGEKCGTYAGYQVHYKLKESACILCKTAKAASDKASYNRRRDKILAKKRIYRLEHLEEISIRYKKWQMANADKISAYGKAWNKANANRIRENKRKYRENNREAVRSIGAEMARRRRARLAGNITEKYTDKLVIEIYGTNCHICNKPIDLNAPRRSGKPGWELGLHIDHIIPISKNGPDTLENVRPAHGRCNISKGAE